ncbi:MAG: class I tRNA ligase family protein, partial [Candidatus ainarchaeum sp.]|nr:class I tRNA ligase family protein [Candidatus ainarchaeum sp.]
KKTKGDIIEFDSPWGRGRPGWHIECSAMARKYAKRTLDIHGGARDLIFPHHENEIAQSEAADGRKFSRYWMHVGFLTVGGEKMSKSLGNFITLKQALTTSTPAALRLFYLQAHYRSPLDYDEEVLQSMEESVERIFNSLGLIREACEGKGPAHTDSGFREKTDELISQFHKHMDDDFNTPEALASLFNILRMTNAHVSGKTDREQLAKVKAAVEDMLWILGLEEKGKPAIEDKSAALFALVEELGGAKPKTAGEALDALIAMRDEARNKKDYKASDRIRARLKEIGVIIEDKPGGVRWKLA